jgi:hypothetical protein
MAMDRKRLAREPRPKTRREERPLEDPELKALLQALHVDRPLIYRIVWLEDWAQQVELAKTAIYKQTPGSKMFFDAGAHYLRLVALLAEFNAVREPQVPFPDPFPADPVQWHRGPVLPTIPKMQPEQPGAPRHRNPETVIARLASRYLRNGEYPDSQYPVDRPDLPVPQPRWTLSEAKAALEACGWSPHAADQAKLKENRGHRGLQGRTVERRRYPGAKDFITVIKHLFGQPPTLFSTLSAIATLPQDPGSWPPVVGFEGDAFTAAVRSALRISERVSTEK